MNSLETAPHLLATLPADRLGDLARSLIRPPAPPPAAFVATSSGPSSTAADHPSTESLDQLLDALSLSVDLKLVALASQNSWFSFRNPRKTSLDEWVRQLLAAFAPAGPSAQAAGLAADDARRVAALAGLYRGLKAAKLDRTLVRDVEIEAVVALEVGMDAVSQAQRKGKGRAAAEADTRPPPILHAAASFLPLLPATSVRALNTRNLIELSLVSVSLTTATDDIKCLSAIIVASLGALANDALHPDQLRSASQQLSSRIALLSTAAAADDDQRPTLFFDFVTPVGSMLSEVLVSSPLRPAFVQRISRELLVAFWRWAPVVDASGGFEAHFEVGTTWWTFIDVLMSEAWSVDERTALVRELISESGVDSGDKPSASDLPRLNGALVVAEQVIIGCPLPLLLPILRESVLPTCDRFLDDNSHLDVFESAHSVVLAMLSKPLDSAPNSRVPPAVRTLTENLVERYQEVLLRNAERQQLTIEQLRHAFLTLVRCAANLSLSTVTAVLDTLRARTGREGSKPAQPQQTYLQLFAAVMPAVPVVVLPSYLASLEHLIRTRTTARSAERVEIVELVWEGVSRLGDEGKLVGVKWWLALQDRLDREASRRGGLDAVQAKL